MKDLACNSSKPYHQFGDSCYPFHDYAFARFDLKSVFGRTLKGTCALTNDDGETSEGLCIDVPADREVVAQTTGTFSERRIDDHIRCYTMPSTISHLYAGEC